MLTSRIFSVVRVLSLYGLLALTIAFMPALCAAEDQDIIGVYFDEGGDTTIHFTTEPYENVSYWVAVKNLSATEDFMGLMFRLEENGIGVGWMTSLIGAQNYGDYDGDFVLGAGPPIPAQDLILICSGGTYAPDSQDRIELNIRPIDRIPGPSPIYHTTDGNWHYLTPSSGDFDEPVAIINPNGVVSDEVSTWGEIKNLFD